MITGEKPYKILVIEDNRGDFVFVSDLLKEKILDPDIVRAVHFKQASAILSLPGMVFDIILLDLSLPDKSGQVLITEMLRLASPCPIIILTGNSDISFSINSISQGIADYLLKDDLDAATLYKSIVYAIEREKTISALTESENRYSDFFHLNPGPVWVYDLESFRFLDVNHAAVEHYGYSREEFLLMTIHELIAADDLQKKEQTDAGATLPNALFLHKTKNGRVMYVEIHSNTILFKSKKAKLVVGNDITERAKYIREIEKQNIKLRDIAWLQSHVVRAPLARMMAIVSLISELKFESPECAELLNHFISSGNELDTIIREIAKKAELNDLNIH